MTEYAAAPEGEPPMDDYDDALEAQWQFNREVAVEVHRLRVREAARSMFAIEQAAQVASEPFDAGTLAEILARPPEPPMRVEGLIPSDASTLLVAQRKTGKTTLILNWARSLILGQALLGCHDTRPIDGNVGLLNFEVSAATVARWADEHHIPHDRLVVVNLRGRRNPLSHPEDRRRLADYLRLHDVEALAVDPFGRAYQGTSQNDPGEVGKWLVELDQFTRTDVGATDLLLATHAGWNGERTRGSSALEDWADVIITMTRDAEDETQRFIRAIGRDVELEEDRLDFDTETRTLRLAGVGSRQKVKSDEKIADLAVYVRRACLQGPVTGRAVLENLIKQMDDAPTFRNGEVGRAAEYAAKRGLLAVEDHGSGRPKVYRTLEPIPPVPNPSPGRPDHPSHPSLLGTGSGGTVRELYPSQGS